MNIQEIEKAQEKWGEGIVKIGELKDSIKECRMFTPVSYTHLTLPTKA